MAQKKQKKQIQTHKDTWVMVSGGFDPIHIGHVRMFQKARKLGDKLVVVLNNDNWLRYKKGFVFMPEQERKELIEALPCVDRVVLTGHKPNTDDISICNELRTIRPAIFANGGDRKPDGDPVPEVAVCKELGIKMVYNVGRGGKVQSSSWMVKDAVRGMSRGVRPWGEFYSWDAGKDWKLKTIYLKKGMQMSMQYHEHRSEHWMLVDGDVSVVTQDSNGQSHRVDMKKGEVVSVDARHAHQLSSTRGGVLVEVSLGDFDENDVVRVEAGK